jgi:hypothetical protein
MSKVRGGWAALDLVGDGVAVPSCDGWLKTPSSRS